MNPDCKHIQARLSALLDEELDTFRAREVRSHAEICSECAARLSALRQTQTAFRGLPRISVSPSFDSSLNSKLAAFPAGGLSYIHVRLAVQKLDWRTMMAILLFGILFWSSGRLPDVRIDSRPRMTSWQVQAHELHLLSVERSQL